MRFYKAIDPNNPSCMKHGDTFKPDGCTAEITLKDDGLFYICNEDDPIFLSVDILDLTGQILRAKPKEPVGLSAVYIVERLFDERKHEAMWDGGIVFKFGVKCVKEGEKNGMLRRDIDYKPLFDASKAIIACNQYSPVNAVKPLKEALKNIPPLEER